MRKRIKQIESRRARKRAGRPAIDPEAVLSEMLFFRASKLQKDAMLAHVETHHPGMRLSIWLRETAMKAVRA